MQLYLDSFGAYLFIRNGMFAVKLKNGTEHTFAVRNVGAILQTAGTAMSADALLLAAQSDIPVILIDAQTHEPLAHLSSGRAVSVAAIRRNQAVFSRNAEGYRWAANCLSEKITGHLELLENTRTKQGLPTDDTFKKARETMRRQAQALAGWTPQEPFVPALVAERFRGQEGTASRLYFQELGRLLDPALGFRGRTGRPAFDPFNALLNYLYGMLYTSVHPALAAAAVGCDFGCTAPWKAIRLKSSPGGTSGTRSRWIRWNWPKPTAPGFANQPARAGPYSRSCNRY